jgi:hypothetical protein
MYLASKKLQMLCLIHVSPVYSEEIDSSQTNSSFPEPFQDMAKSVERYSIEFDAAFSQGI